MSRRQSPLVFNRNNTRACRFNRPLQKAENLTPAGRLKHGKPLRAKRGARPQSEFVTHPTSDYVLSTNARNHGAHAH